MEGLNFFFLIKMLQTIFSCEAAWGDFYFIVGVLGGQALPRQVTAIRGLGSHKKNKSLQGLLPFRIHIILG